MKSKIYCVDLNLKVNNCKVYFRSFFYIRYCLVVLFLTISMLGFTQNRNKYFIVSYKLNETVEVPLLFDSGFTNSILQKSIRKELKLKRKLVKYVSIEYTGDNPLVFYKIKIPFWKTFCYGYMVRTNVEINKNVTEKVNFCLYNEKDKKFKNLQEKLGIKGIIGWDVMRKHNWLIDFKEHKILCGNLTFNSKDIALELDIIEKNNEEPMVQIEVNKKKYSVTFDTGSDGFLSIGENIFNKPQKPTSSNTFYGKIQEKYVSVDSVTINGVLFTDAPIGTYSNVKTHKKILGLKFMSLFDKMVIDNTHSKIYFLK